MVSEEESYVVFNAGAFASYLCLVGFAECFTVSCAEALDKMRERNLLRPIGNILACFG